MLDAVGGVVVADKDRYINVGPDYLGRIPSVSCDILREAGKLWESV